MTVAEFLDEANLELATVQHVLDTAQHALDVADRTQRAGRRIRRLLRRAALVAVVALVGAGTVYAVRAVLARRSAPSPSTRPDPTSPAASAGPEHNGSVGSTTEADAPTA